MRGTIEQRFWSKVEIKGEDECWEWKRKGARTGTFIINGKSYRAHRVAWELHNKKKIPENMYGCHHCDNSLCCNPRHLFVGTQQDNMNDMVAKNRQARLYGENGGRTKLTYQQILDMRILYNTGKFTKSDLARQFDMGWSQIARILNYQQRVNF